MGTLANEVANSQGGNVIITPTGGFPATLAAGATWTSNIFGLPASAVSVAVTSTQVGTLTLQRSLDAVGNVLAAPQAAPIGGQQTQAIVANTTAWITTNDAISATSAQISISNTSGSTATLSGCRISVGPGV